MKLIEIAGKIDKSKKNEDSVDIYEIGRELDINLDWVEQDRLKSYWVGNWYCTDSYVGYKMYFLDDIPVAFSIQEGRKCDENIKWFSKELALKVKEYLITLMIEKEEDLYIETCDINEDIGESYKIQFNNQILNSDMAMLNNESIKIIQRIKETPDWGIDQELKIQLANGDEKVVNISELDFKYHLT